MTRLPAPRPTLAYRITASASWPIVRYLFRASWEGAEQLPDGGFVMAANHTSNFDPWPLTLGIRPRRYLRFMTKSELFRPPLGLLMTALGGFKVRRGESDRAALATAIQLCREGNVVVMFPEGTRQQKGLMKRRVAAPHTGAARIALRAGVPLVPVGIAGTDRLSRLGPLRVKYGAPLDVDDLKSLDRKRAAEVATERLMEEIRALRASIEPG